MRAINRNKLWRLVLSAMFMAMGYVLPFLTGQIPQIGNMLLPMHIPVLFCGLLCGWQYGLTVGALTPLLRSLTLGKPFLYPTAIAMAFELAAYGFLIGFLYGKAKKKTLFSLYFSLISAMLFGRAVWGSVQWLLLGLKGTSFPFGVFLTEAFAVALPGIVLQLVLIPSVMLALRKTSVRARGGTGSDKPKRARKAN